jgi:excisionase family DNA binding protein
MEIKPEEYSSYLKEEYLSIREAAELLEIGETELRGLIEKHSIPTHQIAGAFLRLKKKELEELKNKWRIERELFARDGSTFVHGGPLSRAGFFDRIADFWYFNDFYVLCSIVIFVLLYFIVTSQ